MATEPKQIILKNGKKRWRISVHLGCDVTRSKSPLRSYTANTKTKVLAWAAKMESLRNEGGVLAADKRTARQYLEWWLDKKEKGLLGNKPRSRTISDYQLVLERWIFEPTHPDLNLLGGCKMKKLNMDVIDYHYESMREHGATHGTIHRLHGVLRQAFAIAVKKKKLTSNPTDNATLPAKPKPSVRRAMTAEQAAAFLEAARKLTIAGEDRYSALWHVLLDGALRPGEAFGLKWGEVDFEASTVHVVQTLVRIRGKGWRLEEPKTEGSVRTVPLNAVPMQELRKWKMASEFTADDDFVFTTENGTPLHGARRSFTRVCEVAGLGEYGPEPAKPRSGPTPKRPFKPAFTIYELRHTCLTIMADNGVPLATIRERAGHAPNSTMLLKHYLHSDLEKQRSHTKTLGGVLYGT